jgi:hypothetical protein
MQPPVFIPLSFVGRTGSVGGEGKGERRPTHNARANSQASLSPHSHFAELRLKFGGVASETFCFHICPYELLSRQGEAQRNKEDCGMTKIKIPPVVINGERVLLPITVGLFLICALLPTSILLHWPTSVRTWGTVGLLLSPAFLMISFWEAWRYQHRWRTVLAVLISLIATVTAWTTLILRVLGRL